MSFAIPPYIDPNARGTQYVIPYAYHIYTAVRHQTPLQGHRVIGSQGRKVADPQNRKVTRYQGHWVIGSLGYPGHWVIESPSPYLPNAPLLGSPGSQVTQPSRYPGTRVTVTRVTGSHGNQIPKYQGHGSPGYPTIQASR